MQGQPMQQQQPGQQQQQVQPNQLDAQGFPFQSCMLKMQGGGYSQQQALVLCNQLKQKFLASKQQQSQGLTPMQPGP